MSRLWIALLFVCCAMGQDSDGVPVRMLITAEGHKGSAVAPLSASDVLVFHKNERRRVSSLVPINRGTGMQLWLLIDDGTDSSLGTQFDDLKKFVRGLDASTSVAIGYLRNGTVDVAARMTDDHEAAAKSIRLPLGMPGISASPYVSLTDLIDKWPAGQRAREVVLITSGIDPLYGPGPDDPYLSRAIDASQKAGVMVHTLYYGSAGHGGHSYWQIYWGQNYLSRLAEEAGGEFYWQGTSNPVSLSPYFTDLNQRFREQYEITFLAKPESKGSFQSVRVTTEATHISITHPAKVWVPVASR